MTARMDQRFAALKAEGRPALVTYFMGGDPDYDTSLAIMKALPEAGADVIDCSSGQVWKEEKPVYGRLFQTPFSDKIRNEVGIATIAVGAISEADHANSIIAAGRANLCAVARPHLADPYFTLHAAADYDWRGISWPKQYEAGRDQLYQLRMREREEAQAADSFAKQRARRDEV